MSSDSAETKIHRGLKDVYFERSDCTRIDGKAGELSYRGYSIHDLAAHSTFEETAYLLLHGALPNQNELTRFDLDLKAARQLPAALPGVIEAVKTAHPMDVLRTAVSALAAFEPMVSDNSREATLAKGVRLISQIPMIVAAHARIRDGKTPLPPDASLNHAANFLWLIKGERPSADAAKLLDTDLVLHAEHGSNASSFAARVVIGTDANLHAAITAAIATLSGPAHGGAAEDVMQMAAEIGSPENVRDFVTRKRAAKEAITGFGHRVYRTEDPRARHMRAGVQKLSAEMGQPQWYAILQGVVEEMKPYARHGVNVNVDFYSGVIYYLHGIPKDLFVPIFAIGRTPGWIVQVLEQQANNILIRPLTLYSGPQMRPYVPIAQRG